MTNNQGGNDQDTITKYQNPTLQTGVLLIIANLFNGIDCEAAYYEVFVGEADFDNISRGSIQGLEIRDVLSSGNSIRVGA